uniref:Uncharacterized protein n=1 Tax=Leersia perrieri TaxID=77586 RepID=A0A0D9WQ94_9ORYZ
MKFLLLGVTSRHRRSSCRCSGQLQPPIAVPLRHQISLVHAKPQPLVALKSDHQRRRSTTSPTSAVRRCRPPNLAAPQIDLATPSRRFPPSPEFPIVAGASPTSPTFSNLEVNLNIPRNTACMHPYGPFGALARHAYFTSYNKSTIYGFASMWDTFYLFMSTTFELRFAAGEL